jgi:protease I
MNAGAKYAREPVVVDSDLVIARRPPDLPPDGQALLRALAGAGQAG